MGKEFNYESKYVKIDFDGFPQVVFAIKDHAPTEVEFDEFLNAMKQLTAIKKIE